MTKMVNIHQAKTHLSKLLEEVYAGQEVILAKAGKPYAKLVPFSTSAKRPLGFVQGKLTAEFFDPLPEGELAAWE